MGEEENNFDQSNNSSMFGELNDVVMKLVVDVDGVDPSMSMARRWRRPACGDGIE